MEPPRLWDESVQGGSGINGGYVRKNSVYAELPVSLLQTRAEFCVI